LKIQDVKIFSVKIQDVKICVKQLVKLWMRFALHDAFRRKPGVIALVGTKAPLSLALAPRNDPLPEVLYL
jgi:hypothetical protein